MSSVNENRGAYSYKLYNKVKFSLNITGNLPQRLNIIHKR